MHFYVYFCIRIVYLYIMTKQYRQQIIRELISENKIENQDMLLTMLQSKGFDITQATLSRDIKELKIIKVPHHEDGYVYQLTDVVNQTTNNQPNIATYGYLSIEFSGQLAVIKTRPGYAMGIAAEIDDKATNTIMGTVAGDDTILVILRENVSRQHAIDSLSTFIPIKLA